jgi:hypothetical protein
VTAIGDRWDGAVELTVECEDADGRARGFRSLAYLDLVAQPRVGDRALLNIAAVERGLGTGGYALVVAVLDSDGHLTGQPEPPQGHLVKARYTPLQAMIGGVDEQGSRFHDQLDATTDLAGLPVVIADLHSALAPIIAAIRDHDHHLRIAYLMTDEAALPIAFSRTVSGLQQAGWLASTITCGQAYGGDFEAVNLHSGLLAARVAAEADIAIVTQGPGNLGTGTRWGFSGTAVGEAVNAVSVLGGRPIGSLRISGADPRPRHRGLSHHSLTAYGQVALRPAELAVPDLDATPFADDETLAGVGEAVATLSPPHHLHRVDLTDLAEALTRSPVRLSSMGRGPDADPGYFLAAAAAGRLAVQSVSDFSGSTG